MKIILAGEPLSQIRMKFSSRGGFVKVYDPRAKDKKRIKEEIDSYVKRLYKDFKFFEHPRVSFIFHMPIPKGIPKRMASLYSSGTLKHEKKPDVDNLIKLTLDCMSGILFEDDKLVSFGPCVKLYHPEPKTIIYMTELADIVQQHEVDSLVWSDLFEPKLCK